MSFHDTIYNAMYEYIKNKNIDLVGKDWIEVSTELGDKYLEIVEGPLTDAISDAIVEKLNEL